MLKSTSTCPVDAKYMPFLPRKRLPPNTRGRTFAGRFGVNPT